MDEDFLEDEPLTDKQADVKTDAKPDAKKDAPDAAAQLRKENEALRARLSESDENAKFWHDRAKKGDAPKPAIEEPKLTDDAVEAISSGDPKRIRALLSGLGFVEKEEMTRQIEMTKNQVVTEQELYTEYPDLRNPNSEFFKVASRHFQELQQDPDMRRSPRIAAVAAKLAKAELKSAEKTEDADDDRAGRVQRQAGDRGRRTVSRGTGEDTDALSEEQREIISRMRAAGANITEEGYKKRSQLVNRGGSPARRN